MSIKAAIVEFIQANGFTPIVMQVARLVGRRHNRTSEAIARMVKAGELAKFRGRVWVVR